MKIFIENSFLFEKCTGMGQYTKTVMNALSYLNLKFYLKNLQLPLNTKFKYFWHSIWLNTYFYLFTILKKPNVVISPAYIMPWLTRKNTKYITVIHDICFYTDPEASKYTMAIYDLSTKIAIKKADVLVTVSETVKQDLVKKFNVDPKQIKIVYNSISENFLNFPIKNEILEKYSILKNKYILSVATLNKRKNIPELIKAFESISEKYPELRLVLVGGMGNEKRDKLTKHHNIIFTGYVKDDELPTLYKNALLYMSPSLNEGFGIPIIEAQYSECPVLCSDTAIYREIAGGGAEFCTTKSEGIAEKIEYLINDPERREELVKTGKENVKRFSIEKVAEQLKEIISYE